MECPRCGSENIQAITKKKRRSIIGMICLTVITGGIFLIFTILKGRKEQTRFVCLDCKHEFK